MRFSKIRATVLPRSGSKSSPIRRLRLSSIAVSTMKRTSSGVKSASFRKSLPWKWCCMTKGSFQSG